MDFKEAYKQLNPEQKKAVDAIEGPVMVVAGPGTGKTQILVLRIANILLKTDTPASGILALTFTEAGAKEMKRRVREIIGSRADEVRVHTYHGFAASVIAEFPEHFPHLSRTKQLTDIETESMVRDILKEKRFAPLRPYGEPDLYVGKIIGAIADSKKEAWTPDMVASFAADEIKRIENDEDSISSRGPTKGKLKAEALKRIEKCERTLLFAEVYRVYESRKRTERMMDFEDLIFELITALKKDELLLRLLQEKYLYILVDEHQDTNDAQNALIRLIADFFETPNLFVVGDEKQAIYRFQGASVENFLKFQSIWQSMKVIPLRENYRSHQSILDATFAMIERNYDEGEHVDLRVRLKSANGQPSKPLDVVHAGNAEAGDEYLVKELAKIKKGTVAIIVRRNRDIPRLLSLCEEHGIQASAERGTDIFSHPVGSLFFSLIEFLADTGQTEALAQTIAGGLWKLTLEKSASLIRAIRSGTLRDIERDLPELKKLANEITHAGSVAYLTLAGQMSGLTGLSASEPLAAEVWHAIIALAQHLARSHGLADDPRALIKLLLEYRTSAEKKTIKISTGSPEARVKIMTAHGSKGLEFDYVFLPYATEEAWLPRVRGSYFVLPRGKEEGDEIRDSRRLFYVALTRAKKHVSIIAPLQEGLDTALTPLRFLSELDPNHISKINIPAVEVHLGTASLESRQSSRRTETIEYAKSILLEKGLSVTALNHFCDCPRKFFYKSILKLPEPPSANAEKGNAMHEALARVWHLKDKSQEKISKTIIESVSAYFNASLLPSFEKEPLLEDLIETAPIVAAALKAHVNQLGTIMTETWTERLYEGEYQKTAVPLLLHGKLDAVLETAADVLVFDYKTREAMSENAIKGQTKDSDGNYFRQLVFYKMLLENKSKYKNKTIQPALVFLKPDAKGQCKIISLPVSAEDIRTVEGEIQTLITSVWSGNFLTDTCDDKDCEFCALRKLIQ